MPFADGALARRLEQSEALGVSEYAEAQARLSPGSACWEEAGGGRLAFSGPGGPLSRAVGLGLAGPVLPSLLDRVEAFYASRQSACQVDVSPYADRSLTELLGERGYRITEFNTVLVRPLAPADRSLGDGLPVEARPARADEERAWCAVLCEAFAEEGADPADLEGVARPFFHLPSAVPFGALRDGTWAGAGLLTLRGGLAQLLATGTAVRHRGKGVQTALLKARVARAAADGADLAVCYTLPGSVSQRNVERLGFVPAFTKLVMARETAGSGDPA